MSELSYKMSGVDVDANAVWTSWIAKTVKENRAKHGITHVGPIGGFAGAMRFPPQIIEKILENIPSENPTKKQIAQAFSKFSLVACCDGIGTKTMLAERLNHMSTIGYDLLAMNVNDMVAGGATPIAFLDYIGCKGIMEGENFRYKTFVEGLIEACRSVNVELIGGETSEMKDNYTEFGSDITGFAIGTVMDDDVPNKDSIISGDKLFALKSSGIHSNGYSLVRLMLDTYNIDMNEKPAILEGKSVAETIMTPTRLYVEQALAANATKLVKSMSNITGGGLLENIERSLPKGKGLTIKLENINQFKLPIFEWIKSYNIKEEVMLKTFNMGYGFSFIAPKTAQGALEKAVKEELYCIGEVVEK